MHNTTSASVLNSVNESAYQHGPMGLVALASERFSLLKVSSRGVLGVGWRCVCVAGSAILGTLLMRAAQA